MRAHQVGFEYGTSKIQVESRSINKIKIKPNLCCLYLFFCLFSDGGLRRRQACVCMYMCVCVCVCGCVCACVCVCSTFLSGVFIRQILVLWCLLNLFNQLLALLTYLWMCVCVCLCVCVCRICVCTSCCASIIGSRLAFSTSTT
jgi:hypothetical protein